MGRDQLAELSVETTGGTPWPHLDEDLAECIAAWNGNGPYQLDCPRVQAPYTPKSRCSRLSIEERLHPLGSLLSINVGGVVFRAGSGTLRKATFFESMLRHVETGGLGTAVDEQGRIFIDRSGELFTFILEFLRSGHWLLRGRAGDTDFIEALREEARFYGLDVESNQVPAPQVPEYVTVWHFCDDAALYVDCLEPTIRQDPDHQGLFRYCKYSGGLPLDMQTCTKRFKATSLCLQSIIAYFAMRGFSLKHVLDGTLITHTTSAEGPSRTGRGTQYVLSRLVTFPSTWHVTPPPTRTPNEVACERLVSSQALSAGAPASMDPQLLQEA